MASAGAVGNRPARARNQPQVLDSIVETAVGKRGCLEADILGECGRGDAQIFAVFGQLGKNGRGFCLQAIENSKDRCNSKGGML
jgi:hypothetical protein